MSEGARAGLAFAVAGVITLLTTPIAIRAAVATDFFDRPREYRRHARATPFLGGAAVLLGVTVTSVLLIRLNEHWLVLLAGAALMWVVGTTDDRISVSPLVRVMLATACAVSLWLSGLGWTTDLGDPVNIILTVLWTVAMVNAFNLMDNMDGACSTVACVAAANIGVLSLLRGDGTLAAASFALCGACAGFLPWNLAGPARVFLGDGGSMPVGYLVAVLGMAVTRHSGRGDASLLASALLVGLPILDVTLVSISRIRRGVSLLTGGRDHLTHRLLLRLDSPRWVAGALATSQAALGGIAVVSFALGTVAVIAVAVCTVGLGACVVAVLDSRAWRPEGIAHGVVAADGRERRRFRSAQRTSTFSS